MSLYKKIETIHHQQQQQQQPQQLPASVSLDQQVRGCSKPSPNNKTSASQQLYAADGTVTRDYKVRTAYTHLYMG